MHRSGTSAVAGALELLGVDFGQRLMPPREGENTRGYFEDLEIYEAHTRLLSDAGHSWDDPRALAEKEIPREPLDRFRDEIRRILRERFTKRSPWAVKDPRICLLASTWSEILEDLGVEPAFVIVHRHPDEVAASLASRNGFSAEKSAALWLHHNLAAEASTRGRKRAFIAYDEILDSPSENLAHLADPLNLTWPLAPRATRDPLSDFISPALRNHRAIPGTKTDFGRFGPWPGRLHDLLLAASTGNSEALSEGIETLQRAMPPLEDLVEAFSLEHIAQRANPLEREVASLRNQLISLADGTEKRFLELQNFLEAEEREKIETAQVVAQLQEQLDERARWLRLQEDEIETHKSAIKALQEQLDERTRWLQIQSEALDGLHEEVERLKKSAR